MIIPKTLDIKIKKWIKKNGKLQLDWDFKYKHIPAIKELLNSRDPFSKLENELSNQQNSSDMIAESLKEMIDNLEDDFIDLNGPKITWDDEGLLEILFDSYGFLFDIDYNYKELLDVDIPIVVRMISNYDCINSHHFETSSGGYTGKSSYFADILWALNINPETVKEELEKRGIPTYGHFPKFNRKAFVTTNDFIQELINGSCGAMELVFLGTCNLYDLLSAKGTAVKFIIPKGNKCGLFSSFHGGGSVLDMNLLQDVALDLSKTWDRGYRRFAIKIDEGSYSVQSVFGCGIEIFGSQITIKKTRKPRNNEKLHFI